MPEKRESKPQLTAKSGILGLFIVSALLLIAVTSTRLLNSPKSETEDAARSVRPKKPQIEKVAALGKIEPQGEIMSLSAPTSLEAVQVEQLLVQIGDRVTKGQTIAILDGVERQQAALNEAEMDFAVAQARLRRKLMREQSRGAITARQSCDRQC